MAKDEILVYTEFPEPNKNMNSPPKQLQPNTRFKN